MDIINKIDKVLNEVVDETITLYRGLEKKFDADHDLSSTDSPVDYSTWTNNPQLAREYAGKNGYVYKINLPKTELKDEYIDHDGERALVYKTGKSAGLNRVRGDEYLIYHDHDLFNIDSITEYK
jgi:predicted metalloendopeptidase